MGEIVFGDFADYMECPVVNKKGKQCVRFPATHPGPHKFKIKWRVVLVPNEAAPS